MSHISTILATAAVSIASFTALPSMATEATYFCYMSRANGTVIDLSSLCQNSANTIPLSPDTAFLNEFQKMASQYPDPLGQKLSAYLNRYEDFVIRTAKATCQSPSLNRANQRSSTPQRSLPRKVSSVPEALQQMIPTLATKYYCSR